MDFSEIKGTKSGGCFSRVGAASLSVLPRKAHHRAASRLEHTAEQPEEMVPIENYIDKMLEGINIDYELSKKRVRHLEQRQGQPRNKHNSRSASQSLIRIRKDAEPTMPTMEFMLSIDKCERFRKPKGCALSMFAQERMENELPKRDESDVRLYRIAEREFKKEIAHMRKGMESLKSINLLKK